MRLAIMQPYFAPYIGYFQLMEVADKFVVYDDVNYINKGWINRNRLLVNGKEFLFTIPIKEASQNKLINELYLETDPRWRGKLLKTIEQAYKKAPYFASSFGVVEKIINAQTDKLSDYLSNSLQKWAEWLELNTEIVPTSTVYQNTHLKAQDRILDICRQENATEYVNAIGGMALYDNDTFEQAGIQLYFQKVQPIEYTQFKNDFVPWLSIIDLMMFNDKATIQDFLKKYDLV
ncbi:MAG: WbqC family protein [Runella sp.]